MTLEFEADFLSRRDLGPLSKLIFGLYRQDESWIWNQKGLASALGENVETISAAIARLRKMDLLPKKRLAQNKLFTEEPKPKAPAKRNLIFDALGQVFLGTPNVPAPMIKLYSKLAKQLKDYADFDEQHAPVVIAARKKSLAEHWTTIEVTPTALVKHWIFAGQLLTKNRPLKMTTKEAMEKYA